MKDKINIAELLRDCPKGMELYSPLCGKCVFDRLNMGTIICKKQNTQEITFTSEGYYMLPVFDDCECVIFPSKDQRDWSKFQRPFKDGTPNKFDINTLVPFESRVLVRDNVKEKWHPGIWGFYDNNSYNEYSYKLIGDISRQCIPYEGNEHLLGTTDNCSDYFKTWE